MFFHSQTADTLIHTLHLMNWPTGQRGRIIQFLYLIGYILTLIAALPIYL